MSAQVPFAHAYQEAERCRKAKNWKCCENRYYVLNLVQVNGTALEHVKPEFQDDAEVAMVAVSQTGLAAQYASSRLRGDPEFMLEAFAKDPSSLKYASHELRNDADFMHAALDVSGVAFTFLTDELKRSSTFMRAAISKGVHKDLLQHVPAKLRADQEFVLLCVSMNGLALEHAADELKSDKDIVLAAVRQNRCALQFASPQLKRDREVMLAVQSQNAPMQDLGRIRRCSTAPSANRFMLSNSDHSERQRPASSSSTQRGKKRNSLMSTMLRKSFAAEVLTASTDREHSCQAVVLHEPQRQSLRDALGQGLHWKPFRSAGLQVQEWPGEPEHLLQPQNVKRHGKLSAMTPATRQFVREQAKRNVRQLMKDQITTDQKMRDASDARRGCERPEASATAPVVALKPRIGSGFAFVRPFAITADAIHSKAGKSVFVRPQTR